MRDREPEEPDEELLHVAAAEDPIERNRGDREADEVSQKMKEACAVAAPESVSRSSSHAASNLSSLTHLVLSVPGTLGRITRAG